MVDEDGKNESWARKLGKSLAEHTLKWFVTALLIWLAAYLGGQSETIVCAFKPWLGLPRCNIY